jgi:hypothetical protein
VHAQKHLLTAVLGFLPMLQHAPSHMPDQPLIVLHYPHKSLRIAGKHLPDQHNILLPLRAAYGLTICIHYRIRYRFWAIGCSCCVIKRLFAKVPLSLQEAQSI